MLPSFAQRASRLTGRYVMAGFDASVRDGVLAGHGYELASSLHALGLKPHFAGAQKPAEENADFSEFINNTNTKSVDGDVTYDALIAAFGEGMVIDMLSRGELFAFAGLENIPGLASLLEAMLDRAFAHLGDLNRRVFLFDLSAAGEQDTLALSAVLPLLRLYNSRGECILFLSSGEALQTAAIQGYGANADTLADADRLEAFTARLRTDLALSAVCIGTDTHAAYATRGTATVLELSTTTAEHAFRARCALAATLAAARLIELPHEDALTLATTAHQLTSEKGSYPTRQDFLRG